MKRKFIEINYKDCLSSKYFSICYFDSKTLYALSFCCKQFANFIDKFYDSKFYYFSYAYNFDEKRRSCVRITHYNIAYKHKLLSSFTNLKTIRDMCSFGEEINIGDLPNSLT